MTKRFIGILAPLFSSIAIIALLAAAIGAYRHTFARGPVFYPDTPRQQTRFEIRIPLSRLGALHEGSGVLLRVTKDTSALFSTRYWADKSVVMSMPVQLDSTGLDVSLSLWDAGLYTVDVLNPDGTSVLFTTPLKALVPIGLYLDDCVLLSFIAFFAWASGRIAKRWAPIESESIFGRISGSAFTFPAFVGGGILLALVGLSDIRTAQPPKPLKSLAAPSRQAEFQETEGRTGAAPAPLAFDASVFKNGGYLVIHHLMDSWSQFGHMATLFEGPVPPGAPTVPTMLLPDDGRYRMTLWSSSSSAADREGPQILSRSRWTVSARPVSPPFPVLLATGLFLFSIGFFLAGISFGPRQRERISHALGRAS
jgi:hypothetical protein